MPAAAVIPAPVAYIKVVAVKKLVVGFLVEYLGPPGLSRVCADAVPPSFWGGLGSLSGCVLGCSRSFTLIKLECLKQACAFEYISME